MNKRELTYHLPQGWDIASITDLTGAYGLFVDGDWIESKDQNTNGTVRLIQLADIGDGEFRDKSNRFMTYERALELNCTFLEQGDILVARMPDPIGRATIFPFEENNKYVSVVDVAIIRTGTGVFNKYLAYFINSPAVRKQISALQTGTTRQRISRTNLGKINIPVPPLKEQHRIVEKIEELFSELEISITCLTRAKQQLKIYRQVLLKNAFEGKLTESWRQNNNASNAETFLKAVDNERTNRYNQQILEWKKEIDNWNDGGKKGKKPIKPQAPVIYPEIPKNESNQLPELPIGWKWIRNNELLFYITSGSRDWKKYYADHGAYFIRTQDIKTNQLDLENAAFVELPSNVEGKRSRVERGDLLMTITGANVGKIAQIRIDIPESYISQSVALLKPIITDSSPYLHLYFQSNTFGGKFIQSLVYGVGRQVLSLENMREVPVPICSLEEQTVIRDIVEEQFSIIDNLDQSIDSGFVKLEDLRESILKNAFDGKLVPQDINDENASELLMRIASEKQQFFDHHKKNKIAVKKKVTKDKKLIDVIKDEFPNVEFTLDELKNKTSLPSERIKIELFEILEKGTILESTFNVIKKLRLYKIK